MNSKIIKLDFPIFAQQQSPYVYLDSAATSHKPHSVIDTITQFYSSQYATVYRGIYHLSEQATEKYEAVRTRMAQFIGAQPAEIVFTKGATEGINFIASTWAADYLQAGDHIIISEMEHHANFLPWLQLSQQKGVQLVIVPVDMQGQFDYTFFYNALNDRVKLIALTHVSHIFGSSIDMLRISEAARTIGARLLIDACQSAPHGLVNVATLKPDFLVFSGHKMLGPTGVGVLYINQAIADEVRPYQLGGGMVFEADYTHATWRKPPHCFEAGTPAIAQVIGLGAAIDYLMHNINFPSLWDHEKALRAMVVDRLKNMPGVTVLGPDSSVASSIVTFGVAGRHPHDVGAFLDAQGVSVRAGDHCAQPVMKKLGMHGSLRLSFYCYTTMDECSYALDCLHKIIEQ